MDHARKPSRIPEVILWNFCAVREGGLRYPWRKEMARLGTKNEWSWRKPEGILESSWSCREATLRVHKHGTVPFSHEISSGHVLIQRGFVSLVSMCYVNSFTCTVDVASRCISRLKSADGIIVKAISYEHFARHVPISSVLRCTEVRSSSTSYWSCAIV